jgi:hypothetical protein
MNVTFRDWEISRNKNMHGFIVRHGGIRAYPFIADERYRFLYPLAILQAIHRVIVYEG